MSDRTAHEQADVVVVGAGVSGLTAAWRLVQAGVGSVVVLEAKERVGGRTVGLPVAGVDGLVVDGGGELIGPGQDPLYKLLAELGLDYFDTNYTGLGVYERDGERGTFSGGRPALPPEAEADF